MKRLRLFLILVILSHPFYSLSQTFEQIDSILIARVKTGNDSLQIKLVTRPELSYNKFLTIVAKTKDGWYGEYYRFDLRNEKKERTKIFNLTDKYSLQPKKNWEKFINELYNQNILTLTSKECGMLDGTNYTFKIITQNSDREYKYNCYGAKPMDDAEKNILTLYRESKRKRIK